MVEFVLQAHCCRRRDTGLVTCNRGSPLLITVPLVRDRCLAVGCRAAHRSSAFDRDGRGLCPGTVAMARRHSSPERRRPGDRGSGAGHNRFGLAGCLRGAVRACRLACQQRGRNRIPWTCKLTARGRDRAQHDGWCRLRSSLDPDRGISQFQSSFQPCADVSTSRCAIVSNVEIDQQCSPSRPPG